MRITDFLKRPYHFDFEPYIQFRQAMGFGTFVFLFLWFFAPFGLESLPTGLVRTSLFFGGITTGLMILLNVLIPPLFSRFFDPESWTVGRELLYTMINIGLIGLGNYAYFSLSFTGGFSWTGLIWFQMVTLCVSIFPIGFMVMRKEARDSLKYGTESAAIDKEIRRHHGDTHGHTFHETVVIYTQNGTDELRCPADHLLLIEASDNYIQVYLREDDKVSRHLIRQTLQEADNMLRSFPQFYRCHRSYLVNLDNVTGMHGNAQGYKLELNGLDKEVPVSRKLNDTIREKLTIHP